MTKADWKEVKKMILKERKFWEETSCGATEYDNGGFFVFALLLGTVEEEIYNAD